VRIAGRAYVYLRRHALLFSGADQDFEAILGANSDAALTITRGLVELTPDGRTKLVCGWGPSPRPEEVV
jgi:hypothetical protein